MAMANMNLIGVFVTKLWPVQALVCGGGGGDGGDGGATKNIISPKFSNFVHIISDGHRSLYVHEEIIDFHLASHVLTPTPVKGPFRLIII